MPMDPLLNSSSRSLPPTNPAQEMLFKIFLTFSTSSEPTSKKSKPKRLPLKKPESTLGPNNLPLSPAKELTPSPEKVISRPILRTTKLLSLTTRTLLPCTTRNRLDSLILEMTGKIPAPREMLLISLPPPPGKISPKT